MGSGGMSYRERKGRRIAAAMRKQTPKGKWKPLDISRSQGWTLSRVETRLRKLKHEELFAFDENGKIVAAYRGGRDSVRFPSSLFKRKGLTVTHGHPAGIDGFGGTLSIRDTKNMLISDWAQHRAVASGQGELNYILRKGRNADPKAFLAKIVSDESKLVSRADRAYMMGLKKALARGKPWRSALHVARQMEVGEISAWYKENAPKYGYEYIVRKEPYEY